MSDLDKEIGRIFEGIIESDPTLGELIDQTDQSAEFMEWRTKINEGLSDLGVEAMFNMGDLTLGIKFTSGIGHVLRVPESHLEELYLAGIRVEAVPFYLAAACIEPDLMMWFDDEEGDPI